MKIVLVSTYDAGGGAAIACYRLAQALIGHGHQVNMLVGKKTKTDTLFVAANTTYFSNKNLLARFSIERFMLLLKLKFKKDIFQFSTGYFGQNIHEHPAVLEADVVNLHWVHHNFLSTNAIGELQKTNKPIVWTLHDMWAFTGGCHYTAGCNHYTISCGNCPYLRSPSANDLSAQIWKSKKKMLRPGRIHFVSCSKWLASEVGKSGLLANERVTAIANPIDIGLFKPLDKLASKKALNLEPNKFHILFASANTKDERKGFIYFKAALEKVLATHPGIEQHIEVVIFGKMEEEIKLALEGISVHFLGSISSSETIVAVYNAADIFVIPSLQDNLPNTIMESLACGTPVVGYATGGIPEMIVHQDNGYLCPPKSIDELAAGMLWVFNHPNKEHLQNNARNFVVSHYQHSVIAAQYTTAYQNAFAAIAQ